MNSLKRTPDGPHNWFCDVCEECGWAASATDATSALAAHVIDIAGRVEHVLDLKPGHYGHIEPTQRVGIIAPNGSARGTR